MDKYLEYMGSTYNLEDPLAINHLKIQADVLGMTFDQFMQHARAQENLETYRTKVTKIGDVDTYEKPDGTIYYLENDQPLVADELGRPLKPNPYDGERQKPQVLVAPMANDAGVTYDSVKDQAPNVEIPPAPPANTPAASDENSFDEAMMQYYRDKDAKGGTKLAEWATNFETLAKRNYENQLRRNPELANPGQAFKDSWVSEAFGQQISASNAQLPDFEPGSSNLNYSLGNELSKFPDLDSAYTDFSRNNINPGEVTAESELKDFDFSELIKEFDYRKLL